MTTKDINISLDLKRVTAQQEAIPILVEGDNGNSFHITLTDDSVPVDVSDARILVLFSKTSDGSTVEQDTDDASISLTDIGIDAEEPEDEATIIASKVGDIISLTCSGVEAELVDSDKFNARFPEDGDYQFDYISEWKYGDDSVQVDEEQSNLIHVHLKTASYGAGKNNCEIQIYSGSNQETLVTTAQFNFDARKGIMNDNTIKAEEKYPVLVNLISAVRTALDRVTSWIGVTAHGSRTDDEASVTLTDVDGHKHFEFAIPSDVHIGSDEPTGNQTIWLDPSGDIEGLHQVFDITIPSEDWDNDAVTVSVSGLMHDCEHIATVDPSSQSSYYAFLDCGVGMDNVTTDGVAEFFCRSTPTVDLEVRILQIARV